MPGCRRRSEPDRRAELLAAFKPNVHAEDGCIEYVATVDTRTATASRRASARTTIVIVETWASLAHLKAHGAAPHMGAYAARTKDLIANRVIHVLLPA